MTAIVALHDLNLAAMFCDTVVVLQRGRVTTAGAPVDVLTSELIAEVYGVRAHVTRDGSSGRPTVTFQPRPPQLSAR
ncbi:ABC transporter ATP-binding protein [Nocardioides sp. NPDC006273]|uniref:ABC transporter ATP-binding protein n=1 Tax=Nocardioides sp. NPDC006273 TaxID=3155598 RepID=UPI0033A123B3